VAAPLTKSGTGDQEELRVKLLHKDMTQPIDEFVQTEEPPLH
jgi:hypothetical protein